LQRREISLITLVLNSPCIDLDLLKDLAARSVLIGVDGGLNSIIGLGLKPEWAVGDFDSVNPEIMQRLTRETKILRFPVEKDYTDIELALNLAGKYKPKLLNVLGLWGGERWDHQLTNSVILSDFAHHHCKVIAWSERARLTFTKGMDSLSVSRGKNFSVLSLSGPAEVCIYGAKYSGVGIKLFPGSGYGLGNEIKGQRAWIAVKKGVAGLYQWRN